MMKLPGRGLHLGLCAVFLALAACGDDDEPRRTMEPTNELGGAVEIVTFVAEPTAGTQNGKSTLSWETRNAERVRILQGSVELFSTTEMVATGRFEVNLPSATNQFTLEASSGSETKTQTLTVTALPPVDEQVRILEFSVSPTSWRTASQEVTLSWRTQNAADVSITANGVEIEPFSGAAAGTTTLTIAETTVFVLTASRGNQRVTQMRVSTQEPIMGTGDLEPNNTSSAAQTLMLENARALASGTIDPVGDVDVFAIDVPENGSLIAGTTDPGGKSCAEFDSILALYAPDGTTVLAENDDINTQAGLYCSRLDARMEDRLRNLPAGRYYLAVRGFSDPTGASGATGAYELRVEIRTPSCGNQIVDLPTAEQCDDGNAVAADGCNATCQIEIAGLFTGPSTVARALTGALAAGASQYVQVTLTSTAWIRAQTFAPAAPECTGADTVVLLLNSVFEPLTGNDDIAEENRCSLIEPNVTEGTRLLPPDTYYLRIVAPDTAISAYEVVLEILAAGCGNRVLESSDVCDDGNTASGDGCDATCRPEPAANVVEPGLDVSIDFDAPTDVVAFSVTTTSPNQTITATLAPDAEGACAAPYPTLALYDADWRELGRVEPAVAGGEILCAALTPQRAPFAQSLPVGTYYVVALNGVRMEGSVGLSIRISGAACGNGILEPWSGEICDDHNTVAGDGCDAACAFEMSPTFTVETEPNGALADANDTAAAAGQTVTFGGTIGLEDADYYTFTVPQGATVAMSARIYGVLGDPASCNGDTRLAVLDSAGAVIAENDDGLTSLCSSLEDVAELGALTEGTYFVRVTAYAPTIAVLTYYLDLTLN